MFGTMSDFDDLNVPSVLLLLLSVIGLTWFLQWKLKRRHLMKLAAKIPTPENFSCYPIIGHAHHFIGDTERHLQTLLAFSSTSLYPQTIYGGHMVFHLIVRPEDLEVILNSPKALAKHDLYRFFKAGLGHGLLSLDVKTWRIHRKIIAPTLNQRILNSHVKVFAEQSRIMTSLIGKEAGKELDILQVVLNCALDCAFETSMGAKFDCQTRDEYGMHEIVARTMEIGMLRLINLPLHLDLIFNLTPLNRELKRIQASTKVIVNGILAETREKYQREKQTLEKQPDLELTDSKRQNSLIYHLVKVSAEETHLSDDEITSEAVTFVGAGSDTVASAVSFALTCLALFPEIQQRVYEEVIEVMGRDRDVEASDLPRLKYTEAALKESMRLFPVVPVFLRKLDEDLELETCTLPKGAGLILCTLKMHRNPLYFKDPLKFIPERFTPEEAAKRHPYSFLPFSAGQRNCIGLRYGMMLSKCLIASIVRKFVLSTEYKSVEEIRIKQAMVIKPVLGFKLHLNPRDD